MPQLGSHPRHEHSSCWLQCLVGAPACPLGRPMNAIAPTPSMMTAALAAADKQEFVDVHPEEVLPSGASCCRGSDAVRCMLVHCLSGHRCRRPLHSAVGVATRPDGFCTSYLWTTKCFHFRPIVLRVKTHHHEAIVFRPAGAGSMGSHGTESSRPGRQVSLTW